MTTTTREPQATESYATFWQPLAAPTATPAPTTASAEAKDAYLEFTNVTEGAPGTNRPERT